MYEEMTPEKIKGDILKEITTLDTREGSFSDDMAGPMAVQLYKVYQSLNAVQPIVWVNEGSGGYLDMAAEDLGIEPRKAGTKAAVTLELTGTAGGSGSPEDRVPAVRDCGWTDEAQRKSH